MRYAVPGNTKIPEILPTHLDGALTSTRVRVTNGDLEGMNSKVKVTSHRASD